MFYLGQVQLRPILACPFDHPKCQHEKKEKFFKKETKGRDNQKSPCLLDQARRTKELRCPELSGDQGRARLVVLACETGGRWSEEAHDFLRQLARARARWEPPEIRQAASRAWFRRWCTALACCAAQAFALFIAGAPWRSWHRRRGALDL